MRQQIREEVSAITALDALEQGHIDATLAWIDSGAELCRLVKPATPPRHLVAYFALVDGDHVLLVDHRNARLWLPPGGHVDPAEHPRDTVVRELQEELGIAPPHPPGAPLMITCSETVGMTAGHTDVSMWYVLHADRRQTLRFDDSEFVALRWFPFDAVPFERADPHLARFLHKLKTPPTARPCTFPPS